MRQIEVGRRVLENENLEKLISFFSKVLKIFLGRSGNRKREQGLIDEAVLFGVKDVTVANIKGLDLTLIR